MKRSAIERKKGFPLLACISPHNISLFIDASFSLAFIYFQQMDGLMDRLANGWMDEWMVVRNGPLPSSDTELWMSG